MVQATICRRTCDQQFRCQASDISSTWDPSDEAFAEWKEKVEIGLQLAAEYAQQSKSHRRRNTNDEDDTPSIYRVSDSDSSSSDGNVASSAGLGLPQGNESEGFDDDDVEVEDEDDEVHCTFPTHQNHSN